MYGKISNNLSGNLGGSRSGYLYFVYMWSVSGLKVEPKSHQLLILVILAASLVLNLYINGDFRDLVM